jgi:hypothetical protein
LLDSNLLYLGLAICFENRGSFLFEILADFSGCL